MSAVRAGRRRSLLLIGIASLLAFLAAAVLVGLANARADPVMRSFEVALPEWTPGAQPLRAALLADIHLGNRGMDGARLSHIVAVVNAAKPDLVLIAGDFLAGHDPASKHAAELTAPLERLHAPLGVIAVLGNHDYWGQPEAVRAALNKAGIAVLDNQALRRGPLTIVGISDRFSQHDNVAMAAAAARRLGGAMIVLTHDPDVVPDLPPMFTLVLAGHTHCGQVIIPGYGPLLNRSPYEHWRRLYDPHYLCGVVRDPGRVTIVTGGLGSGTIPVRWGAMPDWWLLTFHSDRSSACSSRTTAGAACK